MLRFSPMLPRTISAVFSMAVFAVNFAEARPVLKANETSRFDGVKNLQVKIGPIRPVAPD